jgi:glycosyltransferase involved in cell wall biosynthesis
MKEGTPTHVTVIDMQPITPAVGGGRLRLLGLYHALGSDIECTYVGSYDWPGEAYRDQQVAPGLREIVVPLSAAHHHAAAMLSQQLDGRTVIDTAFAGQAMLSPEFLRVAREHIAEADVVIFSHPWCFPPLEDSLRPDQLVVYESHNVEALLRYELLGDLTAAKGLLEQVAFTERAAVSRADLVLACSEEDVDLFQRIFNTDPVKLRIVPNGTFVDRLPEPADVPRAALRERLGLPLDRPIAIFLGSHYGPNAEAAKFIARQLAPICPEVLFVVAGGVGETLSDEPTVGNLIITGGVDDLRRDELLLVADLALNPMNAGSGTNIKMFDYMAAGLPVLTTEIGARGIGTFASAPAGVFIELLEAFPARCRALMETAALDMGLRKAVRETVRRCYSWERISKELGVLLINALRRHRASAKRALRVALMSTWNVTCGIGEHSAFLADAFAEAGADTIVLGNSLTGHQPLGFERDLHNAVSRVWQWDNRHWRDSGVDWDKLQSVLSLARPDLLIIQHHTAYVHFYEVEAIVKTALSMDVRVIVEMHDARNVSTEHRDLLCAAGAQLVVHHAEEKCGIRISYINRVHVLPLPVQRAKLRREHAVTAHQGGRVIGGFGFLRPYKGLMIAVKTLAILRHTYPELRYRGWHAFYNGDESQRHLRECMEEAERLGIRDAIEIDTRFLPIEELLAHLQTVDAVLMPYEPSEEGASAAVNLALAAGRPIVASPSAIFRPVADVIRIASRHSPDAYVKALDGILSDPSVARELTQKAVTWAEENSYAVTVRNLLTMANQQDVVHRIQGVNCA